MEKKETSIRWTSFKKILFLFFGTYIFLYIFPFPFVYGLAWISSFYTEAFDVLVAFTGRLLFGVEPGNWPGASSDTLYDFTRILVLLQLAVLATIFLFTFLRRRLDFDGLYRFLWVYARYFLAFCLFVYGLIKLDSIGQFGRMRYEVLEQTYGDSSPMHLLWAFMAASKPYTVFTGIVEILAAALLLFRRTSTVGALLTLAIMVNVLMLNLFYDVPVKLFSIHLILVSLFILSRQLVPLFRFFFLRQPALLAENTFRTPSRFILVTRFTLKAALLLLMVYAIVRVRAGLPEVEKKMQTEGAMDGVYQTTFFVWGSDTLQPDERTDTRWKQIIVEKGSATISRENDYTTFYAFHADTSAHFFEFRDYSDSSRIHRLDYQDHGRNIVLSGKWQDQEFYARFKRKTYRDYLLLNREFRWISDKPFNW